MDHTVCSFISCEFHLCSLNNKMQEPFIIVYIFTTIYNFFFLFFDSLPFKLCIQSFTKMFSNSGFAIKIENTKRLLYFNYATQYTSLTALGSRLVNQDNMLNVYRTTLTSPNIYVLYTCEISKFLYYSLPSTFLVNYWYF